MHMADSLLSPAVGGVMWAVAAAGIAYCSKKIRIEGDDRKAPLMGVLGAFVFAAQMINFTIPGTGSSGHLGGGLLLAVLLGPHAALLTIASVLFVQALFFADGGLLALGCNIFNLGVIPAFVVYPLIYRPLAGRRPTPTRLALATVVAAIVALQLGALAVVLQTLCSGIAALPFATFALLMQPIHLPIGLVEGLATVAVVSFVARARPDILAAGLVLSPAGRRPLRGVLLAFLAAALVTGGILSWFASAHPDGLEWAIARASGLEVLPEPEGAVHAAAAAVQERVAWLPDYSLAQPADAGAGHATADAGGTGVAGVVGGLLTLAIAFLSGLLLKRRGSPSCR
jgi:cobalt/nickel transport system permease protein